MNGQWDHACCLGTSRRQPLSEQDWTEPAMSWDPFGSHQLTCHYNKDISALRHNRTQIPLSLTSSCLGHSPQPHKKQRTRTSGPFWREQSTEANPKMTNWGFQTGSEQLPTLRTEVRETRLLKKKKKKCSQQKI